MTSTDNPSDLQWIRDQIDRFVGTLPLLREYEAILRASLGTATKRHAPFAVVQTRVKSIDSFAEKIRRKKGKYANPLGQITDLCGARVITDTVSELEAMARFVESHFEIDRPNSIDVTQRLSPTEFGYRSTHYVVTLGENVDIPPGLWGLKAEIQLRTFLEHAWAEFSHRVSYKSGVKLPSKLVREMAALSAVLEEADGAFSRLESDFKVYAAEYEARRDHEEIREEMAILEHVLEHDHESASVVHRLARLAMILEDWPKAVDLLTRFGGAGVPSMNRDLGIAICKLHRKTPADPRYREGQGHLEAAVAADPKDVDAICSLAGTWKGIDEERACSLYRRAYEAEPSNPYALGNYIECILARSADLEWIGSMKPLIDAALERCHAQAEAGVNVPWAWYDAGKFELLLGRPYDSLASYSQAILSSGVDWMMETSLRSLDRLAALRARLEGYNWARGLLVIARSARCAPGTFSDDLRAIATPDVSPFALPVVVVVGVGKYRSKQEQEFHRFLLHHAFREFRGTVISGGTMSGVSELIGEIQKEVGEGLRSASYAPARPPSDEKLDLRYKEIRGTSQSDFSPMEPIRYWADILASGISPTEVRVLALGGGQIAEAECQIALALGAWVGMVEESGGTAMKLLADDRWGATGLLIDLPADRATLEAFIGGEPCKLPAAQQETIARAIHEAYRAERTRPLPLPLQTSDPSMSDWEGLREDLKESNRQQADHIGQKLRRIGCTVVSVHDKPIELIHFTDEEVETLSEMEHGRWNVERLFSHWRKGPEKDVERKIHPYILPWTQLDKSVQDLDRQTVRKIPEFLASVGLEVRRES